MLRYALSRILWTIPLLPSVSARVARMRRAAILGLAALALAPAAAAAPGFRYGVAAGEMTSTSATLWTRSNQLGPVKLYVWPAPRRGMPPVQVELKPSAAHDRIVQRRVHGLKPGTRYTYL